MQAMETSAEKWRCYISRSCVSVVLWPRELWVPHSCAHWSADEANVSKANHTGPHSSWKERKSLQSFHSILQSITYTSRVPQWHAWYVCATFAPCSIAFIFSLQQWTYLFCILLHSPPHYLHGPDASGCHLITGSTDLTCAVWGFSKDPKLFEHPCTLYLA